MIGRCPSTSFWCRRDGGIGHRVRVFPSRAADHLNWRGLQISPQRPRVPKRARPAPFSSPPRAILDSAICTDAPPPRSLTTPVPTHSNPCLVDVGRNPASRRPARPFPHHLSIRLSPFSTFHEGHEVRPSSSTSLAKPLFSARNPYPGWIASAADFLATSQIRSLFR